MASSETPYEDASSSESWLPLRPDGQSGCGLIMLTVCLFKLLHGVVMALPLPQSLRIAVEHNRTKDDGGNFRLFRWHNLIISCIHASITAHATCICLFIYGEAFWADMIDYINWPAYLICCFGTGYFIYDTIDIMTANRLFQKWEILMHHVVIVACTFWAVVHATAIGYHVVALTLEVNTMFLHTRKLLQWARFPRSHWLVRLNRWANLLSFVPFRFLVLLMLGWRSFGDASRVPLWYLCMFRCSILVLLAVNVVLYYRLIVADLCSRPVPSDDGYGGVSESVSGGKPRSLAHHKKIDSTAGVCGSLNVGLDYVPTPNGNDESTNVHSKNE